jgi:hypothetical protein
MAAVFNSTSSFLNRSLLSQVKLYHVQSSFQGFPITEKKLVYTYFGTLSKAIEHYLSRVKLYDTLENPDLLHLRGIWIIDFYTLE